jgi:hypothetical protein
MTAPIMGIAARSVAGVAAARKIARSNERGSAAAHTKFGRRLTLWWGFEGGFAALEKTFSVALRGFATQRNRKHK